MLTLIGFLLKLISSFILLSVLIVWLALSTGLIANANLYIECATSFIHEFAEEIERRWTQQRPKNHSFPPPEDKAQPEDKTRAAANPYQVLTNQGLIEKKLLDLGETKLPLPSHEGTGSHTHQSPDHYDQIKERLLQTMDILEGK